MFLTQEELKELTGFQIPKCQIRVLRENGIKFILGGDGKPRVLTAAVEDILGIKIKKIKNSTPNYQALKEAMGLNG